jgi:hypothetical protein
MYRSKIVTIPARQQQNEARREAKVGFHLSSSQLFIYATFYRHKLLHS